MVSAVGQDLKDFAVFVENRLRDATLDLTPEDLLAEYRQQRPCDEEYADGLAALREAIDSMEAGDQGRPVKDVLRELRQEFHLN